MPSEGAMESREREHPEHHLRKPTHELSHEEKLSRQTLHIDVLTGTLVLVLLMLVYSAVFDLDSAAEWIVFGGITATAIGALIAVRSR